MAQPITPPAFLAVLPEDLRSDALEDYEERAAILEYEAGLPRPEAEAKAAEIVAVRWSSGRPV